jgi:hypothetical protein
MVENRRLTLMVTGGLGDCLLASAFVRYFHEGSYYSDILCALPAGAAQLYDCNPRVNRVVPCAGQSVWLWGLPEEGADIFSPYVRVVPDGWSEGGPGFRSEYLFTLNQGPGPAWRQVARYHGLDMRNGRPELYTCAADEEWADRTIAPWRGRRRVLIGRRTPLPEKEYPLAHWQAVVDALRADGALLEFSSDGSPLRGTEVIQPWPSLRQAAALMRRCDCAISIDSFQAHLAAAVGTPAVVLFGPTNPAVWGHPTSHCLRTSRCPVCADTPRLRECARRRCMEEIPPELVVERVRLALAGLGTVAP